MNIVMNREQLMKVYEEFFRCGGYRVMRLLVIKAELGLACKGSGFDVVALMRLQHSELTAEEQSGRMVKREVEKIRDIYCLDAALRERMKALPRNWGQVLDMHFGRGIRTRSSGAGLRKRTVDNALAGLCRELAEGDRTACYDFALEGVAAVAKVMSFVEAADGVDALILRAVESMKLFRYSSRGISYDEALEELLAKTCANPRGAAGIEAISSCMVIGQETREARQLSGLERKVREGCSSVLIERMYEIYGIMTAIGEYLPEKYERMMSFHWTHNQEKLTELFREAAAMLAAEDFAAKARTTAKTENVKKWS